MIAGWVVVLRAVEALHSAELHRYVENASFRPVDVGAVMWPGRTRHFPIDGFNPSLVQLSNSVRVEIATHLIKKRNETRTPWYAAATRRSKNLCMYLGNQAMRRRRVLLRSEKPLVRRSSSTLVILDRWLAPLAAVIGEDGRPFDFHAEDVRLKWARAYGQRILVTSMRYKPRAEFDIDWLWLRVEDGKVVGSLETFKHRDVVGEPVLRAGRNFGVLWDGGSDDPFHIVYWLSRDYVDVRRGLPAPERHERASFPLTTGLDTKNRDNGVLHNNGLQVSLENLCPGLVVAPSHVHLDTTMPSYRRGVHGATPYGNTYISYFVVFNKTEPYRQCAMSPPFCFPSPMDPSRCDTIQFLSSMTLDAAGLTFDLANEVTIAYGVNDCDAAYTRLRLKTLLEFVYGRHTDLCRC